MIYIKTDYKKMRTRFVLLLACLLLPSAIQAAAAGGEIDLDDADKVARSISLYDQRLIEYPCSQNVLRILGEEDTEGIARVLRSVDEVNKADKNYLLKIGMASVVRHRVQPLYVSVREMVGSVLRLGGNPNMLWNGQSPLSTALLHTNPDLAQALIEAKADIYISDRLGRTPLDFALMCSSEERRLQNVQLLIDAGADGHKYLDLLSVRRLSAKLSVSQPSSLYWKMLFKMGLDYNRVPENMIQENPELMQVINELKGRDREALGLEIGGFVNESWLIAKGKTSILAGFLGMAEL